MKPKLIITTLSLLALCAGIISCTTATATRTANGQSDSIIVKSFLSTIQDGSYSNGSGMTLSVSSATPDQKSIAILAGTVGDIAKAGMLLAAKATNAPPASNPPPVVIVSNTFVLPAK